MGTRTRYEKGRWRRYDSTQDDPTHFGVSPTLRFRDFAGEVCTQINSWRKVSERSYNNEKTCISYFSNSFGCRVDGRLWRWIANHATAARSPVGKSFDSRQPASGSFSIVLRN